MKTYGFLGPPLWWHDGEPRYFGSCSVNAMLMREIGQRAFWAMEAEAGRPTLSFRQPPSFRDTRR